MITLKEVKHYADHTNSVEATWVDENGIIVRCHSYADVQMDMLRADLGEDAPQYADLIARVESRIVPPPPKTAERRKQEIQAEFDRIDRQSIRPLREGDAVRIAELNQQAEILRTELGGLK